MEKTRVRKTFSIDPSKCPKGGDHLVDEGTEKWEAKRSDLKSHFLAHIEELGGTYKIEGGIVYASLPDGTKWDFTVPEKK